MAEINEAWTEFTRPRWIVDNRALDPEQVEKGIVPVADMHGVNQLPQRTDFISWLITWKAQRTKKKGSETTRARLTKERWCDR